MLFSYSRKRERDSYNKEEHIIRSAVSVLICTFKIRCPDSATRPQIMQGRACVFPLIKIAEMGKDAKCTAMPRTCGQELHRMCVLLLAGIRGQISRVALRGSPRARKISPRFHFAHQSNSSRVSADTFLQ